MRSDILMNPIKCTSDVLGQHFHRNIWKQSVIASDKQVPFVREVSGLVRNIGFIACLPSSTMDPKYNWEFARVAGIGRFVDIQHVPRMAIGQIRYILDHNLGLGNRSERGQEKNSDPKLHDVAPYVD
jgi:hypothetical protein